MDAHTSRAQWIERTLDEVLRVIERCEDCQGRDEYGCPFQSRGADGTRYTLTAPETRVLERNVGRLRAVLTEAAEGLFEVEPAAAPEQIATRQTDPAPSPVRGGYIPLADVLKDLAAPGRPLDVDFSGPRPETPLPQPGTLDRLAALQQRTQTMFEEAAFRCAAEGIVYDPDVEVPEATFESVVARVVEIERQLAWRHGLRQDCLEVELHRKLASGEIREDDLILHWEGTRATMLEW